MVVCSVSRATSSLSAVLASSPAVSVSHDCQQQQLPCQQDADTGSVSLRIDDDERTDAKLLKCSADICPTWQLGSLNGILPVSCLSRGSPESRRVHRPDSSPYHVRTMDRSPLQQQMAGQSMPLGRCPDSVHPPVGLSYERNGLLLSADNDRMDTSDDMPLNLSTGVRSSVQESANVDNRRRIFTSGE